MDTYDLLADPRALPLTGRRACAKRLADDQASWHARLKNLVEGPPPEPDFPAFLLATPAFEDLGRRLGSAESRTELATEVADELDWFVEKFANYLRTDADEDAFDNGSAPSSADPGALSDRPEPPRAC